MIPRAERYHERFQYGPPLDERQKKRSGRGADHGPRKNCGKDAQQDIVTGRSQYEPSSVHGEHEEGGVTDVEHARHQNQQIVTDHDYRIQRPELYAAYQLRNEDRHKFPLPQFFCYPLK